MNFGVETDAVFDQTQLDAIHVLEGRLDRADPRITNHIDGNGIDLVDTTLPHGHALTAIWRFRGEACALTVTGHDWFHVWSVLAQFLCSIFKVGYWFYRR